MTAHTAEAPRAQIDDSPITPTRNGAEVLIDVLVEQGVEVIFGYPGGAVLPIYDALFKQDRIRHILVRHEQAAVHAAEGYARSTGKPGVVLVTSGPGATNAVTGLLDALMDSIPLVCLTGQVPTHVIGSDAFQEADTTGITRPCTKHNYLVKSGNDLARVVHEAFHVATSGRPGPVVVDLPKDVVVAPAPYLSRPTRPHRSYQPQRTPDPAAIAEAVALLRTAERPLIYVGGGVINAGPEASAALRRFVALTGFPVTSTLMGLGAIDADDASFIGMLGMHGAYEANLATHGCDVLLNIGARFDDRVTGRLDAFSPDSRKIHIDIDPSSINKIVRVAVPVVADARLAIEALIDAWGEATPKPDIAPWWRQIDAWRAIDSLAISQPEGEDAVIKPQYAIRRLYEMTRASGRDTFISTEVGQHQMWAAQHFGFDRPNRWLTSGGLGTMGYGLPAAAGAQIAHPEALCIDIAGEASILMNIQELGTLAQYRLPVKIFILNNRYMGMVRQWQELLHGSRYSESYSDALPDFVKLAESFHAKGLRATKLGELDGVIAEMLAHDGPVVAEISVDEFENVFPMIPSGAAHNEMILGAAQSSQAAGITEEGMMLV
ncbi:acetolactate synthase-1/2/3 large subunit [Endobacter medicaginis]|uniref:Acetolactate synthase n=1 Tax=Endobacter medicaginis TaxID=1181271 RepID=A0A839UWM5_9PROT|nr:biosynthetic-type acetolactate synthase large subunit [Endobacter medicaginis]MBB3173065.1 acetolactate synthase-1/2/3 large subunit [Endobacter medicaginis]MCX5474510.1 biosynthetic-type acetolactate synthase large subunit [Endobacter medicaginis]NVN30457.1 biosynthetic-type acetolactate synthase large subunit [Endobacter medicaginis]